MLRRAILGACAALLSFALTHASGCGTDAVGVEDCRKIESARCHAGAGCGLVSDAATCERFYRNHCLHGLAREESPGAPSVAKCVAAIEAAGDCGTKTELAECTGVRPTEESELETPCDVVLHPEWTEQCAFLSEGSGGAGGSAGAGGSGAGGASN